MRTKVIASVVLAALILGGCSDQGGRLERIRAKGFVTCGVKAGVAGFATVDAAGNYAGMDVDACRMVAAAIFGDPAKVKYVTAENINQLRASDEIDMVARRITWSLTRATSNGLMFGPVYFYDGQGLLVPRAHRITDAAQLANEAICVHAEESHAATLAAFMQEKSIPFSSVAVGTNKEVEGALHAGRCKAYSADISLLGGAAAEIAPTREAYDILPVMMSKEPLAALVRQGDDQFFEIVRWSFFATVAAEEMGLTSVNVGSAHKDALPETQRFLGAIAGNGAALGLDETWAVNVIKGVGNYGEMFDRNVGANSALKLERGLNKLWTDGGLMYAPRLR